MCSREVEFVAYEFMNSFSTKLLNVFLYLKPLTIDKQMKLFRNCHSCYMETILLSYPIMVTRACLLRLFSLFLFNEVVKLFLTCLMNTNFANKC
jgi:hypothetical protein